MFNILYQELRLRINLVYYKIIPFYLSRCGLLDYKIIWNCGPIIILKNFNFFSIKLIFLAFFYHFDMLILKNIIILMYF